MKVTALGTSLLCFAFLSAHAQTPSEPDSTYEKCLGEHGTVNNAVVEGCSNMASDESKRDITKHYQSIYKRLLASEVPESAKEFEASQKAWLQYRNLHCNLAGRYIGSPMYAYCPMIKNLERAQELRTLDTMLKN
ncbi:MAG: DUF1311 domain-containing protein [Zoogloeaceae bacterium]|jgi:uncharacterized protein YecT (DUF1311 family)|nr:DUF1311 domain-containing protein [Zoogloeaceae bacterium]